MFENSFRRYKTFIFSIILNELNIRLFSFFKNLVVLMFFDESLTESLI